MNAEEQRNLQVAKEYEELYNSNAERFVRECYMPDCMVYAMGGGTIHGHDPFVHIEKTVLRAAPKRRMRVDQVHAVGDVVTVEAVLLNPDKGVDWRCLSAPYSSAVMGRSLLIGRMPITQNGRASTNSADYWSVW